MDGLKISKNHVFYCLWRLRFSLRFWMDGLEESERARERQNESARERERERTMFEPEQGSKLQPAEMVGQKTRRNPPLSGSDRGEFSPSFQHCKF